MTSPVIAFEGMLSNSDAGIVNVNWNPAIGNYDLSHYTIHLFQGSTKIGESRAVNSLHAVFAVPVDIGAEIQAKITTTSKCDQTSNGVFTNSVRVVSGGGR